MALTKRPKLKEHIQYCLVHFDEMSKLAKVKAKVSEVKGVMMENIEKVYCAVALTWGPLPRAVLLPTAASPSVRAPSVSCRLKACPVPIYEQGPSYPIYYQPAFFCAPTDDA